MKKIIITLAFIGIFSVKSVAQDYKWAIGIRAGGEMIGADVKYRFNPAHSVKGIFAYPWDGGFVFTGLYEWNVPVITNGFNLYYGAGAHTGVWKYRKHSWDKKQNKFSLGVDAIVGLEYKIRNAPIAFSADYKPVFNIAAKTKFYMLDFAVSAKFTF